LIHWVSNTKVVGIYETLIFLKNKVTTKFNYKWESFIKESFSRWWSVCSLFPSY